MAETAIISGGTGGLGQAVTKAFLAAGWRCVVPYRNEQRAQRLSAESEGDLVLLEADLADRAGAEGVVEAAVGGGNRLGAVLNLAGGFDAPGGIAATGWERFSAQLELNLRTAYQLTAAALPKLLEGGGGAVLFVSSRAAVSPFPGAPGYVIAKRAVLALAELLQLEYGKQGIRANTLLPGVIDTPANRESQPQADRSGWTSPERIAAVALWLCGEEGKAVAGAALPV